MSLLWSTMRWDWRLQWRQGLFFAALFVMLVWVGIFSQINDVVAHYLLPVMLYIDLSVFGFFFMAGLLYLEKGEGVLSALVVTPLRSWHYLVAKLATLTGIGLLVSIVVVALVDRQDVNWAVLVGALILNSLFFTLASFILAARYDAINEFLIPAVWLLGIAQIPFFDSFGIWSGWPLYLLPFQASLLLVRGAFEPLATWQWVYALAYVGACILVGYLWALRIFERFVVRGAGEKSMNAIRSLTLADIRNVNRDSLLRLMLVYPWIMAVVLRWLIPFMVEGFADQFDFRPYYGLLTSFFGTLLMPQLFGYVIGFMLLDERDDGTLTALRTTPLSLHRYLLYKLTVPVLVSIVAVYIFVPVVGLVEAPFAPLFPIALVAAITGPIFALLLASLAANKVQGLAVMKGLSLVLITPMLAYFVSEPWQWLFGFAPTFWPVKAFWQLLAGESWWFAVVIGLLFNGGVLWLLLRHFKRVLGRQSR